MKRKKKLQKCIGINNQSVANEIRGDRDVKRESHPSSMNPRLWSRSQSIDVIRDRLMVDLARSPMTRVGRTVPWQSSLQLQVLMDTMKIDAFRSTDGLSGSCHLEFDSSARKLRVIREPAGRLKSHASTTDPPGAMMTEVPKSLQRFPSRFPLKY